MEPRLRYASPFTDLASHGPEGLFSDTAVDELLSILDAVRCSAQAA